jgi:hypothetical protein
MKHVSSHRRELIAPCGMDCSVCSGYLAWKHDVKSKGIRMPYCSGCRPREKKCAFLKKRCHSLLNNEVEFCYECGDFPCKNLERIDSRYQRNYRMSLIENLRLIQSNGMAEFLKNQDTIWKCQRCGGTICCHNGVCFDCGLDELKRKRKLYRWLDGKQDSRQGRKNEP